MVDNPSNPLSKTITQKTQNSIMTNPNQSFKLAPTSEADEMNSTDGGEEKLKKSSKAMAAMNEFEVAD